MTVAPNPAGGRPWSLTPEITETICGHVEAGHYFVTAVRLAGVPYGTAKEWYDRGLNQHVRAPTDETRAFAAAVLAASAKAEDRALHRIMRGDPNWSASSWWLQRRFRERWAERTLDANHLREFDEKLTSLWMRVLANPELDLSPEQHELIADMVEEGVLAITVDDV